MIPSPGDPVRIATTKWGDRPHWELGATYLGADDHGDWLGVPAGTHHARPGASFDSEVDSVTLAPRGSPWCATFNAPGIWCTVYVDMTTPPRWDGPVLHAVDLDLDVIRGSDGLVWVDDEDEFAEHQVSLGYPPEIVLVAEASRDAVRDAVRRRQPPFDLATPADWLRQVSELEPR